MFLGGLYANTGTLVPYAITTFPSVAPETDYPVNPDHELFRLIFELMEGTTSATWDDAILARRILFPALAWPFMKLGGFEIGGVVASLTLNALGFFATFGVVRREIGPRSALAAVWLLALYPPAAYWAGLPYMQALIVPLCLLLFGGLLALPRLHGWRLAGVSLAMGVAYLGYDLVVFFLLAAALLLVWHRRWLALLVTLPLQVLPLALWLLALGALGHGLANSNTTVFGLILEAYAAAGFSDLPRKLPHLAELAGMIFFGANFLFLPALFLAVVALNPLTSRVPFGRPAWCLLAAATALFLFTNAAPDNPGWQMRGSWISHLYQPLLPLFVFFIARCWEHLPPLRPLARLGLVGLFAAGAVGQSLIILGPLLYNPGRIAEHAYARFYYHNESRWVFTHHCLPTFGRAPLGFPPRGR